MIFPLSLGVCCSSAVGTYLASGGSEWVVMENFSPTRWVGWVAHRNVKTECPWPRTPNVCVIGCVYRERGMRRRRKSSRNEISKNIICPSERYLPVLNAAGCNKSDDRNMKMETYGSSNCAGHDKMRPFCLIVTRREWDGARTFNT